MDSTVSGTSSREHSRASNRTRRSSDGASSSSTEEEDEFDVEEDVHEISEQFNITDFSGRTSQLSPERAPCTSSPLHPPSACKAVVPPGTNQLWPMLKVALIVLVPLLLWSLTQNLLRPDEPADADQLLTQLAVLRRLFPAQRNRSWALLRAALKPVLAPRVEPRRPACVLLAGAPAAQATATLLSGVLATLVVQVRDQHSACALVDTAQLDGATAKRRLERAAAKSCTSTGACCLQLPALEAQPAALATMLHALCDGDGAPHRRLVLFMRVAVQAAALTKCRTPVEQEEVVSAALRDAWLAGLGTDEMEAVLSRMANVVLLLRPEQERTLQQLS